MRLSNNNLNFLCNELPVSRLQRDLKDSSLLRNIGYILSLSLLCYLNINKGLYELTINKNYIHYLLSINTPILSEPIQSRLKILGFHNSYQQLHQLFLNTLKQLQLQPQQPQQQTQTNHNNNNNPQESLSNLFQQNLNQFINNLDIDENEKKYLKTVTPHNYTGIYKL